MPTESDPSPRSIDPQPIVSKGPVAIFLLVALPMHVLAWSFLVAELRTLYVYSETTCAVLDKRLKTTIGREEIVEPKVKIRYIVGGREREAWTFDGSSLVSSNAEADQKALDQFHVGGQSPCWYDPADPAKVVVVRGHHQAIWVFLGISGAFVLLAVLLLAHRQRPKRAETWPDGLEPNPDWLESTPLKSAHSASFPTHRSVWPEPQVLVFRKRLQVYLFAGMLLVVGLAMSAGVLALAWYDELGDGRAILVVPIGLVIVGASVVIALTPATHAFDRQRGTYRRPGWLPFGRQISLKSIRAVQIVEVLNDGKPTPKGGDPSTTYTSYQLNLVLDDPAKPRRNVVDQGGRDESVQLGRELAEFLKVPLFGKV